MNPEDYFDSITCPLCQEKWQYDLYSSNNTNYYLCLCKDFSKTKYKNHCGFRKILDSYLLIWWSDYEYTIIRDIKNTNLGDKHLNCLLPLDIAEDKLKTLMVFS